MRELTVTDIEFWLESSRWFGMTMLPGYGSTPHHSPIKMTGFQLLDDEKIGVDYLDPCYAQGVQQLSVEFDVLNGTADYQVCVRADQPDRTYIFVPLTLNWMKTYFPQFAADRLFDADGRPIGRAILSLGSG